MPTKTYTLIVFLVVTGILSSFYSGYFLKDLFKKQTSTAPSNNQRFKPTFIDEAVIITKTKPHITLKLSAFRKYVSNNTYSYIVKTQYFDGTKWEKEILSGEYNEIYKIPQTSFLPKWEIGYDPSYMLKQNASGEAIINKEIIKFEIPNFENEMPVRSSPKYTKFLSETDGKLTVNGKDYDSYVLYSRIYSFDTPESLVFTSDPAGLETEWLAYWDEKGNFYSIDETIVDNKINKSNYKAHSMAIEKDVNGKVQHSFDLTLKADKLRNYTVSIGEPINKSLSIEKINLVNNDSDVNVKWYVGQAQSTNLSGFGFFEQISQTH